MADAKKVMEFVKEKGVKLLDLRFTDLPGLWHHVSYPIDQVSEASFEEGFGFDGSSIRGWASIHESDMLLIPDAVRFWMEPFAEEPTLCLIANAVDPITKEGYGFDPRSVAQRAESYLKFTGVADTAYFGPEAAFFVFDGVEIENEPHSAGYRIHSDEGIWSSGRREDEMRGPNLGY